MRVLISSYGSRGDVQPMVALAVALQARGVETRLCVPPDAEFVELLARSNVPLVPGYAPVRPLVKGQHKHGRDIKLIAAEIIAAQYDAMLAAAEECDAVVTEGLFPSTAASQLLAERLALPFVYAIPCSAFLPSHHHRPHEFPGHPHPPGVTDNRALWAHDVTVKNALFGEGYNKLRARIGLHPVDDVRDRVFTDRPWVASDPVLDPWLPTDLRDVVQTGAWILPDTRPLPADLETFLAAGEPPVYVGFGSMPMQTAPDAARSATEAVRAQGRRALLSRGWADLAAIDDRGDCFVVGDVNQQALFPRVAAVVHHGGAGTTAVAAMSGTPQLVVPQIGDQPYWASRVAELGIGVAHDGAVPSLESLSAALARVLVPAMRMRAGEIAGAMRRDGAQVAAEMLVRLVTSATPTPG